MSDMIDPPLPGGVSEADLRFLARATERGRQGWGGVQPNPMVGCVLVWNGAVVGEAHHEAFGGPHAEVLALRQAGSRAGGGTAYVSLEPCAHHGKTGPCTEALLEAGIRRVVYGAADPGKESGGGAEILREAGVEVVGPVYSAEAARRLNPAFHYNLETGRTYVALKLAMTLDARISEGPGRRTRLTGPDVGHEVHHIRAGFQGIMVGSGTVYADDPRLTVREIEAPRRPPSRLIVDSRAAFSPGAALFRDVADVPVVVFCREDAPEANVERLEAAGASVHPVAPSDEGVDLREVLRVCSGMGIHSLLCEGGGRLASSFLREGLVQRMYLFLTPTILGTEGVPAFPGPYGRFTWEGWRALPVRESFEKDGLVVFDRQL